MCGALLAGAMHAKLAMPCITSFYTALFALQWRSWTRSIIDTIRPEYRALLYGESTSGHAMRTWPHVELVPGVLLESVRIHCLLHPAYPVIRKSSVVLTPHPSLSTPPPPFLHISCLPSCQVLVL